MATGSPIGPMPIDPTTGLYLPPGVQAPPTQMGLPFGSPTPYGVAPPPAPSWATTPTTPAPQMGPRPAPNLFDRPRPAPSMNQMNSAAEQARATQQAASRPYRPSSARLATMEPTRGGYTAGEAAQLGRMANGPNRPMPGGPRVGPAAPSSVTGGGGVGAGFAATAAAGGPPTTGVPPRPLQNPNPFPQMQAVGGGRLARMWGGRTLPALAFMGVQAAGNRYDSTPLQAAGTAGLIGSMIGGGPAGAVAAAGTGIAEGVAGQGSGYSSQLQDIYNGDLPQVDNWRDVISLPASLGASIPMNILKQADRAGDVVEDVPVIGPGVNFFTDRFGGMAADMGSGNDMSLFNVPGFKQVGEFFGVGAGGPSDEEVAAQEAEARRVAQMRDPANMARVADTMGLPPAVRDQALADFNQQVEQAIALNEVGVFDVALAGDKTVTRDPQTGKWVDADNNAVDESDVSKLSDEQIRDMLTQGFYANLPNLAAQHEANLQRQAQAATYQVLMDRNLPEMERLYQQTADLYTQAGEPEMAANALEQFGAQRGLMQVTPLIQAVDYQQQVDQQLAAMAQQKLLNDAIYGPGDESSSGDSTAEQVLQNS